DLRMYDLAIIGAGWAGLNCALRARQLGFKVCLIEKEKLGGTCLNKGCIPTKTLLHSAKVYNLTKKSSSFGVNIPNSNLDFKSIKARKDSLIQSLNKALESSLKGIDFISGEAKFKDAHTLIVGSKLIQANYIVIATGAKPLRPHWLKFNQNVVTTEEILEIDYIPENLLILGGGVIGCEFASIFNLLGSKIEIVELSDQLLPHEDKELVKRLESIFKKRGIKVSTSTDAKKIDLKNYDLVLVCLGRVPFFEGLDLDKLGLYLEENQLAIDDRLSTPIKNIFACGDCLGKDMFAHFAKYQGYLLAEAIILGRDISLELKEAVLPRCIFTEPEFASGGLKVEAIELGREIKINTFDFLKIGMSHIVEEKEGLIKIISDKNTDEILGASIIGPLATEIVNIFSLAIRNHLKVKDLKKTIFTHPTFSEIVIEALR
ncbi:MAG: FAD-dependent oxidoreductase, partial [Candidatus Omnitrophica bacterium]|nr:FAD-dependent oxidoreductase [Candidatus Omnitrophota bacterium]